MDSRVPFKYISTVMYCAIHIYHLAIYRNKNKNKNKFISEQKKK